MVVITFEQARLHLRVGLDHTDPMLVPYIQGAEDAAAQYLNRRIFATVADMNSAITALPALLSLVRVAYEGACDAANAVLNVADRQDALEIATTVFKNERMAARRTLSGIVVNPSIVSAVLLTLGDLFQNREDSVIGATAVALPQGARSLLRPYRLVMMP